MRVEVDGPVAAGGRLRATVVDAERPDDEFEVSLESFERASSTPRTTKHQEARARPGETVEFEIPATARPGWGAGSIAVGWQVAASAPGLLGRTERTEIVIEPAATPTMSEPEILALREAADAGARKAARSEVPAIVMFTLMALAIIGFGVYLIAVPPEDQTWAPGAVVAVIGVLFPVPALIRYLRRVDSLEVEGCTLVPDTWTTRGGTIGIDVETTDAVEVAVVCRVNRLVRANQRGPGQHDGAAFVESAVGEQRQHVPAGLHRLEFDLAPTLPPTHAGHELRVRHVVQATKPGAGANNHRRTEVSFVVAPW